jgi:hypothetical protein
MNPFGMFVNHILVVALSAWFIAQCGKVLIYYLKTRKWDWSILYYIRPGGMPSAHAAMVSAAAHGVGLYIGYNTAAFAVAFILAMIVIYDAIGVRFHSGRHARSINILTGTLHYGHPLRNEPLREVLGHTPREALAGLLLGVAVAQVVWFVWR